MYIPSQVCCTLHTRHSLCSDLRLAGPHFSPRPLGADLARSCTMEPLPLPHTLWSRPCRSAAGPRTYPSHASCLAARARANDVERHPVLWPTPKLPDAPQRCTPLIVESSHHLAVWNPHNPKLVCSGPGCIRLILWGLMQARPEMLAGDLGRLWHPSTREPQRPALKPSNPRSQLPQAPGKRPRGQPCTPCVSCERCCRRCFARHTPGVRPRTRLSPTPCQLSGLASSACAE